MTVLTFLLKSLNVSVAQKLIADTYLFYLIYNVIVGIKSKKGLLINCNLKYDINNIKTGRLKRSQFTILFFSSNTSRQCFIFLIYILIDYLVHEIFKEFRKHSHFENMRAGFLLRCQN